MCLTTERVLTVSGKNWRQEDKERNSSNFYPHPENKQKINILHKYL